MTDFQAHADIYQELQRLDCELDTIATYAEECGADPALLARLCTLMQASSDTLDWLKENKL